MARSLPLIGTGPQVATTVDELVEDAAPYGRNAHFHAELLSNKNSIRSELRLQERTVQLTLVIAD